MHRRNFQRMLAVFFIFLCLTFSEVSFVSVSESSLPSRLQVYVGPRMVLADNRVHDCILVQLQDSRGRPARATEDIIVTLSSSRTDIGSVDPKVTIASGKTYAIARFYSTYTAGSTTITAIASGYTSGQAVMSTAGPIPSRIAVFAFPPVVPADRKAYDSIIVQLQDAAGKPARAPIGDINVTLASSEIIVGAVNSTVTIQSGKTYAVTKFYSTNNSGSTTITAIAPGYSSGQAKVTTSQTGGPPSKLKVYAAPPKLSAEGISYESICVQLEDSDEKIARSSNRTEVNLASSDISVGTVDSTVTIQPNKTYAITKFYSTYRSGSTMITAIAPNYTSGQAAVATFGPIPSGIAIYALPPLIPADNEAYSIIVQLQDSGGTPARDPIGDVTSILSSSDTEIGEVNSTVIIPFGDTYCTTKLYSKYSAGSTTITAVASGYASGHTVIKSYIIDPLLTVSAKAYPDSIPSGGEATIRVHVTDNTLNPAPPVPGATIELTSDGGGSLSSITDERNGYYSAIFTAPVVDTESICTLMAVASKFGYAHGEGQVKVTVFGGGSIHIQVKSSDGSLVSGAAVSSTSQPSRQPPLSGTTNSEGYVEFKNIRAGSYAFTVDKSGFETSNIQINVISGQTAKENVSLSSTPLSWLSGFLTTNNIWLLLFVALLAIALTTTLLLLRRRASKRKFPTGTGENREDSYTRW